MRDSARDLKNPLRGDEAHDALSGTSTRLARLKADQFTASDRPARIERALRALRTLPDTIRLDPQDAGWIARDVDVEDA
jgi:hypothetical protein